MNACFSGDYSLAFIFSNLLWKGSFYKIYLNFITRGYIFFDLFLNLLLKNYENGIADAKNMTN